MAALVGIAGSLRKASLNRALLVAAQASMPAGSTLDILEIDDVPLYNGDVEAASGSPAAITRLRAAIRASDGLLVATPEYNAGVPGVLKNVFDWLSRPVPDEDSVLEGKPLALTGATPGGLGTALAQAAWLPTFRNLRLRYWAGGGTFYLSRAQSAFADGNLADDRRKDLEAFLASFVAFADSM